MDQMFYRVPVARGNGSTADQTVFCPQRVTGENLPIPVRVLNSAECACLVSPASVEITGCRSPSRTS